MKAFILAAGSGSRLGDKTKLLPKPMIKVHGKPVLEQNIVMCKEAGVRDIYINTHHLSDTIVNYFGDGSDFGVKIIYNDEIELLGTAGGIEYFLPFLKDEPYLVIYGDNFSEVILSDLWDYHLRNNSEMTIALHWRKDISKSGVVDMLDTGRITRFTEKPKTRGMGGGWVNAGIYIINPLLIDSIVKPYTDFAYDIIPELIRRNIRVYGKKVKENVWPIDTPELLSALQNMAQQ